MSQDLLPDWARINIGAAARDALTLIGEELAAEQYRIDQRAYAALRTGTLTAEAAVSHFASKWALYTLQERLLQRARAGEGSARRVAAATEADTDG